jgi:sugar-specific transcriptional regulator TrmB
MPIIKFIPENNVLKTAIRIVKKAKKTLFLTMLLEEEIKRLSPEYIKLIKKKVSEGLIVKRIGFGTKKEFEVALKQSRINKTAKNFLFKFCEDVKLYQRLLIADEKEMLFAVYIKQDQKNIFNTKSKEIIIGFVNYFNIIFDNI